MLRRNVTLRYDVIRDITRHMRRRYKRAWHHVVGGIPGPTLTG